MLRSRTARREEPLDARPAEAAEAPAAGPEHEALLADSLGAALLVVLDTLTPAERLALVLHDMFAVPYREIAPLLDRTPSATKMLASRARRRVQGAGAAPAADPGRQRHVVEAFLAASRDGDFAALLALLHPDAVLRPDRTAARLGAAGISGAAASPGGSPGMPKPPVRPWSTGSRAPPGPPADGSGRSSPSPSRTAGSPRSTSSPTPSASGGSMWSSSAVRNAAGRSRTRAAPRRTRPAWGGVDFAQGVPLAAAPDELEAGAFAHAVRTGQHLPADPPAGARPDRNRHLTERAPSGGQRSGRRPAASSS
ncbi:sigma factor-like helix-turn-helix DNA-binding protein [Actinomadura madurae]|uniref:sigma factor-like helix-turn-helix DNA-binding protein n=1 Tax=Actinomadura madurae TaxID=1993 RepID=UPI0020D22568|nr:sigma factor-like helix-turn-helix DNA-binding protein [Actinomadura madurae]MCP9984166.1 hypothetical protein [Actinomadura madurae]